MGCSDARDDIRHYFECLRLQRYVCEVWRRGGDQVRINSTLRDIMFEVLRLDQQHGIEAPGIVDVLVSAFHLARRIPARRFQFKLLMLCRIRLITTHGAPWVLTSQELSGGAVLAPPSPSPPPPPVYFAQALTCIQCLTCHSLGHHG